MKKRILLKKEDAINHFGTKAILARAIGVNHQAVMQWGEYVPEQSAWPLYYLTKGKIKAEINFPKSA